MTLPSQYDIIYMFTTAGLRAGRLRLELMNLGEYFAADRWEIIVPMMDAIEIWAEGSLRGIKIEDYEKIRTNRRAISQV